MAAYAVYDQPLQELQDLFQSIAAQTWQGSHRPHLWWNQWHFEWLIAQATPPQSYKHRSCLLIGSCCSIQDQGAQLCLVYKLKPGFGPAEPALTARN